MALLKTVHVVRLGTAAAPLDRYLRGYEDAVSWTSDVTLAIPFASAGAAERYAGRRLGGAWHVAEVDRAARPRIVLADEVDAWPEDDAGVDAVLAVIARSVPASTLLTRQRGLELQEHRRSIRAAVSSPWAA